MHRDFIVRSGGWKFANAGITVVRAAHGISVMCGIVITQPSHRSREAIRLRHGVGISGPCTISTKKYAPHLNTTLHLNVDLQIKVR